MWLNSKPLDELRRVAKLIDFDMKEIIGKGKTLLTRGSYGRVLKGMLKQNGQLYAIKIVDKEVLERCGLQEQLLNEIEIMEALKHPNIITLLGYFEDAKNIYLVMELSEEGSLYLKMNPSGFSEDTAMRVDSL